MDTRQVGDAVHSAALGDAGALQGLLVQYHAALRARVVRELPPAVARRMDADDVLQQAYVAAFRALRACPGGGPRPPAAAGNVGSGPRLRAAACGDADAPPTDQPAGVRFDSPAAFYKWLERIALNELKNRRRDLRRQRRDVAREIVATAASGTSYPDLLARLSGGGQTPSRRLAAQEATAAVLSGLARLTEDQRRVVQLRLRTGSKPSRTIPTPPWPRTRSTG